MNKGGISKDGAVREAARSCVMRFYCRLSPPGGTAVGCAGATPAITAIYDNLQLLDQRERVKYQPLILPVSRRPA
jgi:hypothetical protein